ncbi:protein REVEILLE 6-like [Hibiscus syriacus]|uniref:protein REVEILLE 6-like n=1 Tax=Hibiscus syriacus TaxID=106335 RepID=UPI001924BF8C|nr:protein REVEILLE 6-like [Hibiscus syriacus]
MALPGLGPFGTVDTAAATVSSAEDSNQKIRKPCTISKSREGWTEHDKFLEALQLFDRDWKKIEAYVGSKTVIQIRSHAQKYFLKVQKNGTSEHLPPPRPKRKASRPYPQKASKTVRIFDLKHRRKITEQTQINNRLCVSHVAALGHPQVSKPLQSPTTLLDAGFVLRSDPPTMFINPVTRASASSQTNNTQTISFAQDRRGIGMTNNSCSSTESTQKRRQIREISDQGNQGHAPRVLPDFAQIYSFIGSVFDPNTIGHLQKLKKMDPIDVETVCFFLQCQLYNPT